MQIQTELVCREARRLSERAADTTDLKPTSQRCVIDQDTLLSESTCTANKYQLHRHNFGHGRITIHPDLFNRNASA